MKSVKSIALSVIAVGALAFGGNAYAADRVVDTASVTSVADLLREIGYKAEIKTGDDGKKYISSAANGNAFQIFFYGCKEDRECGSFEFYSWYKKQPYFTPDLANEWNAKKRFLKVVIDKDGDLAEYMYVSTIGQVSYENFRDNVDWFTSMDGELSKFLSEKAPAAK